MVTVTRRWVLVVVAFAVLAACGVSSQARPEAVDEESVPFDLLAPAVTTTSTTTTVRAQRLVDVEVFLMASERLQPVVRRVTEPVSVRKAVEALFSLAVSDAELAAGLRSALSPNVDLVSVETTTDGVVTVDLGENFLETSTQEQRVALAQVVFTATGIAGTRGVRFTLEGESREVPTDQGTQSGPLGRDAFAQLAPLPPPPPPEPPPGT